MHIRFITQNCSVSPQDRGLQYGDGFFTTARIANNRIVFLTEHLNRLNSAAQRLSFHGFSVDKLQQSLVNLPEQGAIKILVTREQSRRGYAFRENARINIYVYLFEQTLPVNQSVKVVWCKTLASKNSMLAGIKHINRLDNVLARTEVEEQGFDEGIMSDGSVATCGTQSNLFCIKDNKLWTPQIVDSGVTGIVRQKILQWAKENQISYEESKMVKQQVLTADAIFFTNCLKGVMPVDSIEQSHFKSHPFIALFQKRFLQELR